MRSLKLLAAAFALLIASTVGAAASVVAKVDISSQTMNVYVNGALKHSWKVSTGRGGYRTPTGTYRPQVLKRMHYSSKYNGSPMPHSIFFRGGFAIHGTGYVKQLGRPASHGCVRLAPGNAAMLFSLVKSHGAGSTRIVITN
jgi:lipoprotein-anchoring transpeptidase ErfK/SrfK